MIRPAARSVETAAEPERNILMIVVRPEQPEDVEAVRRINKAAFGQDSEADLVDALRKNGRLILSLVAEDEHGVVGHIAFSVVTVETTHGQFEALGLAPVAVLPDQQRRGIGARLVEAGLEACRELGHEVIFVLGHPSYYPGFGFVAAQPLGLRWEHDVPAEAFMVAELRPGALAGRGGIVRFQPEFGSV